MQVEREVKVEEPPSQPMTDAQINKIIKNEYEVVIIIISYSIMETIASGTIANHVGGKTGCDHCGQSSVITVSSHPVYC